MDTNAAKIDDAALNSIFAEALAKAEQAVAEAAKVPPKLTDMGTPCSRIWTDDWIAAVNAAESSLGHRICGARTHAGTPCTMESSHPNGRCRFHGGFDLTGAPKGNRNAVLHGLYSRRLQVCGTHCPQWAACPCAGEDVAAISARERPTCPYEQMEYNTFLSDALASCEQQPHPDPTDIHSAHNYALLNVMTSRAASALRAQQLTDTTAVTGEHYQMQTSKLNACLQAFLRLSSETRAFRRDLDRHFAFRAKHGSAETPTINTIFGHQKRNDADTELTPESQEDVSFEQMLLFRYADRFANKAFDAATQGNEAESLDAMNMVHTLNPITAYKHEDRVLAAYRPKGKTMPKEAVKLILKRHDVDPIGYNPEAEADPMETFFRNASQYPNRRR